MQRALLRDRAEREPATLQRIRIPATQAASVGVGLLPLGGVPMFTTGCSHLSRLLALLSSGLCVPLWEATLGGQGLVCLAASVCREVSGMGEAGGWVIPASAPGHGWLSQGRPSHLLPASSPAKGNTSNQIPGSQEPPGVSTPGSHGHPPLFSASQALGLFAVSPIQGFSASAPLLSRIPSSPSLNKYRFPPSLARV